jgi:Fe(3+) dicitrate transport protein
MKATLPLVLLIAANGSALAQTTAAPAPKAAQLSPLTVTGIVPDLFELPGSAAVVAGEDFRARGYTNLKQIAATAPGVFVRDEDGFGNFPNISIRGVDGTRSAKVTLMEDGILTAPSPYSAPNAYYSPKSGRMAGIEFLKGSSQVMYGPHTTGGVVNFLSTPIPTEERRFFSRLTAGSYGNVFNQTWLGGVTQTEAGKVGALVELHTQLSDGFRQIDGVGRRSGYTLTEPMVKLSWEPSGGLRQRFELKVGQTDFDADESYAGLSEADLRARPDRRYASSRFDHHVAEQWRTYLKWSAEPDKSLRLDSALYFNRFDRMWDKLDGITPAPGLLSNIGEALVHAPSLALLRGDRVTGNDGSFYTNKALRQHEAYGWQGAVTKRLEAGAVRHELTAGLRIHRDDAGGSNQRITYAVDDGVIGAGTPGAVSSAGYQQTVATAFFIEDSIRTGALTLRPGLRYEYLNMGSTSAAGAYAPTTNAMVMGGLGFTCALNAEHALFGGVYRGGSAANPAGYAAGARSESSLGKELGWRGRKGATSWELVAFHTDFHDLIAPVVGVAGGGLLAVTNGGGAVSYGLEALLRHDLAGGERGYKVPVYAGLTWTHARFKDIVGSRLGNSAGIFAGAEDGHDIPYIPEWKLAAGAGLESGPYAGSLDLSYYSSTWGTGYNANPRLVDGTNALADPSAIDGRVDGLLTVDLNLRWQCTRTFRVVGGVQNLLDRRAIISRAPLGGRANAPRTLFLGGELAF